MDRGNQILPDPLGILGEETREIVSIEFLNTEDLNGEDSDKLNYIFLQLPVVKSLTDSSTFLERWAWSVRNMAGASGKPDELKEILRGDRTVRGKCSRHIMQHALQ